MNSRTIVFTGLLCLAVTAKAQAQAPGFDPTTLETLKDLLQDAMPWITETGRKARAASDIETFGPQIHERLSWTGSKGCLIEFAMEEHPATGIVRQLGQPVLIGEGESPTGAMTLALSQPTIKPGPIEGFQAAPDKSIYVWVTRDGVTLKPQIIGPPFSQNLLQSALQNAADIKVLQTYVKAHQDQTLRHAVEELKRRGAASNDERLILETTAALESQQKILASAEANLSKKLAEAQSAAKQNQLIKSLKGVLTVSALTAQVMQALPDIPADKLKNVSDSQALLKVVEERELRVNGDMVRIRREVEISTSQLQNTNVQLHELLHKHGAPKEVLRDLSLPKR